MIAKSKGYTQKEERWIIAVPIHKLAESDDPEANSIMQMFAKYHEEPAHLFGKNHFTVENGGHFSRYQCYVQGCSECEHKLECPYRNQEWDAQIVICAYELLEAIPTFVGKYNKDVHSYVIPDNVIYNLVFEEDPSRIWYKQMELTPELMQYVHMADEDIVNYWGSNYKFYRHVDFTTFKVDSYDKWQLYQLQRQCENSSFQIHEFNEQFTLFGRKEYMKPYWVQHVVLNCATTTTAVREIIFHNINFREIKMKTPPISNPIIRIGYKWGVEMGKKYLEGMKALCATLSPSKKVMMMTKKDFEPELKPVVTDIGHFGAARGINNFDKEYDVAIIYGGFHYDPLSRLKYMRIGLLDDKLNQMEDAEVIQAFHRVRPHLHPSTPFIICSNWNLMENKEWTIITQAVLDLEERGEHTEHQKQTLQLWISRWVEHELTTNQKIIQCRLDQLTIIETATRCQVGITKVKEVFKIFKEKYADQLSRHIVELFEVDI
jgi:hypothetical protein